ncbi:MAG: ATP synthase subunit C [Candidatus Bathyarchaeia archaeon]
MEIVKINSKMFFIFVLGVSLVGAANLLNVHAQDEATTAAVASQLGLMAIGASIAIAGPGLGAGIGLSIATSSIAAAGAERPEIIGKFFIFVVFIEAIAIYGLIVAVFIMLVLPGAVAA